MEKKKSKIIPPGKPKISAAIIDVLLLQYLNRL
jgi:hypothetical protein